MHQWCLLYSGIITLSTAFAVGLFNLYTTDEENERWKHQPFQQKREREHQTGIPRKIQNLQLGIAEGSCGPDDTTGSDHNGGITNGILCRDRSRNGGGDREPSNVGSIRKRERDAEQLDLVVLEPGQHVGPYLLQEHLGYLGHRPVHDFDPAFHPHEAKRVGYHTRGIISPPPRSPMSPVEGLVLKGGNEQKAREGSYRLNKRFEGGSHGEVWKGVRLGPDGEPTAPGEGFILKRMLLEKGQHVLQAGIREIYFGELLTSRQGSPRVARYVEHLYLFGNYGRGRFGREGERVQGGRARAEEGDSWEAGAVPTEMWLVFRDEGLSLRHYLYTEREADGFVLHGQSNFWRDMRLDPKGPEVMKSILHQILEGASFLHERGILHRDLKPSNLIVSLAPAATSPTADGHGGAPGDNTDFSPPSMTSRATTPERGWARSGGRRRGNNGDGGSHEGSAGSGGENWSSSPKNSSSKSSLVWLRVADFSSAVDEGSISAGLYGGKGPAQEGEETLQYAPPEVLFDSETAYSSERPESYDIWSIGVILLELILGTPEVFTVDQRTRAILERDLAFEDDAARAKAHLLAAMANMCIYSRSGGHPGGGSTRSRRGSGKGLGMGHWPLGDRAVVDERCTLADLGKAIHTRDALDIGFPDQWGLDLLWRLLRWDPLERISVAEALEHAYFKGPYRSRRDGTAHATRSEAMAYDGWFMGSPKIHPAAVAVRSRPQYAVLWGPTGGDGEEVFHDQGSVASPARVSGISGKLVPAPMSGSASVGEERSFTLDHQHTIDVQYTCPKCNRTFELWESCHSHVTGRRHASFCQYDTASLPPCVSSHSMLPFDPHSGWCDVQGRRSRIEDFHSIVFQENYKFYGVFDGHCGTRAAKFASRALHLNLELFLNDDRGPDETQEVGRNSFIERAVRAAFGKTQSDFLELVVGQHQHQMQHDMDTAVAEHGEKIEVVNSSISDGVYVSAEDPEAVTAEPTEAVHGTATTAAVEDDSGTTATVALVYPDVTVVAHVGDSRAVMCCDNTGRAVEITEDHTPYSAGERARVEANGGSVEHRGVLRVNGELAVTRTLGNRRLSRDGVLSSEPDVVFVSRRGVHGNQSGETRGFQHGSGGVDAGNRPPFLVLASDGLWDVVSSQEAVDMVKEVIQGASPGYRPGVAMPKLVDIKAGDTSTRLSRNYGLYGPGQAFQVAATALTHEAYVRGSTDNIGVCVVDLRPH